MYRRRNFFSYIFRVTITETKKFSDQQLLKINLLRFAKKCKLKSCTKKFICHFFKYLRTGEKSWASSLSKQASAVFLLLSFAKDCYISARCDGNLLCGKIRAFFRERDEEFVAIELMKILKFHSSPIVSSCGVYSYHVVEDS